MISLENGQGFGTSIKGDNGKTPQERRNTGTRAKYGAKNVIFNLCRRDQNETYPELMRKQFM
jgi:hypothetical protein